ncbi:MAG: YccF domain-containing protein [Acutalibacteraceae bacterium]
MKTLANIFWMIFGGLINCLMWCVLGVLWCITIVGIPLGKQCFKFASLTLAPFGKEVKYNGGTVSTVANVFWIIFTGFPMAAENFLTGAILCCTIIAIPLGKQYFKIAKLSLAPFGAEIS